MVKLFLSHSSKDKPAVLRLAKELRRRKINVWLDEWEIEVGDSIPEGVEKGLVNARFVAVWLTKHSVSSGWVTKEWQSKIFIEISSREVTVLPLLAEDCDIPYFLADKKFADFRNSFEEGLAPLIRSLKRRESLKKVEPPVDPHFSVGDYVRWLLDDLEEAQIPFPLLGNLKILRSLRMLPRSGKLLRLETMEPPVPIRSIYDHILSVAHSADTLLPLVETGLEDQDLIELARVIAYHDLCEVIIGDVPQYTRLNRSKRNLARVAAEIRLSQLPDGLPERISNEFIGMFLQDGERSSLKRCGEILQGRSSVKRFFYALDKLDPIVAIWRYIHVLRDVDGFLIDDFLERTRHFFENPQIREAMRKNVVDVRMFELVRQLQNPARAREYYYETALLQEQLFAFSPEHVRQLIEGRDLMFVLPRRGRGKTGGKARAGKASPNRASSNQAAGEDG